MGAREARLATILATVVVCASACGATSSAGKPTHGKPTHASAAPDVTTVLVLGASHSLSRSALAVAKSIISHRLRADHVTNARLSIVGHDLRVAVPADEVSPALSLAVPGGTLRFRLALSILASPTSAQSAPTSVQSLTTAAGDGAPVPGSESLTLTAAFEKSFATWSCADHPNPTQGADDPNDYIIACSTNPASKYLLAPAAVEGVDIESANAGLSQTNEWLVNLEFNGHGAAAFHQVSRVAYDVNGGQPQADGCEPPKGCNAVAIVLDGVVESAPNIIAAGGIEGGQAQISGGFTQSSANQLANILKYGALPAPLRLLHKTTAGS